jgi:hypothetical protein
MKRINNFRDVNEAQILDKHWSTKKWCVLENKKDFKVSVFSGNREYSKAKFNFLFQDDDLIKCNTFKRNYKDDEDEQMVGYTCIHCNNTQENHLTCERCLGAEIVPIWK